MKTIEQLKEKKRKEERLAAQCRESAKNHEANAKRIQDEIAYQQGAAKRHVPISKKLKARSQ